MVLPEFINVCCMLLPELLEYPEILGDADVAVQVNVEFATEDCKRIFVEVCEHISEVSVVLIIAGIGFTIASIGVLVRLAQLFIRVSASA